MALVFAAIGIYQYETRDVFWNPKLLVSNAYAPFYRVNSVFWDPSIYGRFLVVAILALLVAVLFGARPATCCSARTAAIAAIWAGLYFSYSQSSFAALAAGVVLAAIFAWGRRGVVLAIVAAVVVAARRAGHAERAPRPLRAQLEERDERPRHARPQRRAHRRPPPARGRRDRRLQARLRRARRPEGQGAERRRLAHDAGHGRGRGRDRRLRALRLAASGGAPPRLPPLRARPGRPRRAHLRPRDRRRRRPQPLLQRVLRGPDRLGRHRPGRRARRARHGASPRRRRRSTGR